MELCRLINSCSYLSFTSSLYLCLFRYTMVFIQKGRNWEAAYYICKICIRKKGQCYPKITSHQINVIFILFFLYLMPSYVDISKYIVLFFKISKSEYCTEACSFCICFEERNYISLSRFMAYDNITLNRKSKKKTKWNYYLQEGSNFMPYYIDTISVHYKWDYFKTKNWYVHYLFIDRTKGSRKGLHKLKTNKR